MHSTRWLLLASLLSALVARPLPATAAPELPTLSEDETSRLGSGRLVLRRQREDGEVAAARFVGLLEIEASPQQIWAAILDFESLPDRTPNLTEVDRYVDSGDGQRRVIGVGYRLDVFTKVIRYSLLHDYRPAEQFITWSLDAEQENEFNRLDGEFSVWPGSSPERTVLVYRTQVDTGMRIPNWVEDHLTRQSLSGFLRSLKRSAEAAAAE